MWNITGEQMGRCALGTSGKVCTSMAQPPDDDDEDAAADDDDDDDDDAALLDADGDEAAPPSRKLSGGAVIHAPANTVRRTTERTPSA